MVSLPALLIVLTVAGGLPRAALSSKCEEEEGSCTLMAVLAENTTWEAFRGSSGNATDGACQLGDAAPVLEMTYLSSSGIVIMDYAEKRTECCQALTILSACNEHVKSAELDQEVHILENTNNNTKTPNATCEGAQLALGQCTVLASLGDGVTAEAFSGASGTGEDGVCALGDHAPLENVETLSSGSIVLLRFMTDLDMCCEAKKTLDSCSSIKYAEYDAEVSIANNSTNGSIANNSTNGEEANHSSNTTNDTDTTTSGAAPRRGAARVALRAAAAACVVAAALAAAPAAAPLP